MGSIPTQSIFQSSTSVRSWRSYGWSIVVHSIFILLALTITIPVIRPVRKTSDRVTLIAPVLPEYKAKIAPPVHVEVAVSAPVALKPAAEPPKVLEVATPKPKPPKPVVLASAPEIKNIPSPAPTIEIKPELPVAPRPPVQTGVFEKPVEVAKNTPAPKLTVGGFGDPNGATPSVNAKPAVAPPQIGAFDAPSGSGANGGSGRGQAGAVKQSAFGDGGVAGSNGNNHSAAANVKTSGFDDAVASSRKKTGGSSTGPAVTPVQVIAKPRPVYSVEARNLRLEGHVSLQVVFLASGSIRVIRVVHGLGHGLDEAAEQAAMQVRFKPAMRDGVPVDMDATIDITFELT